MDEASWTLSLELETPAGRMLRQLASSLPQGREFQITVFGSAPLQIAVDPNLTSADVDVFSDFEELNDIVMRAGLGTNQADFYIQVSSELNFRTSPRWKGRTQSARIGNSTKMSRLRRLGNVSQRCELFWQKRRAKDAKRAKEICSLSNC